MSLATRCTHCGTTFKVVEDQLKVSEGWVRCGRCHEVFNAHPTLFDLAETPPAPLHASSPDEVDHTDFQPTTPVDPHPLSPNWPARPPQGLLAQIGDLPPPPVQSATDFELDTALGDDAPPGFEVPFQAIDDTPVEVSSAADAQAPDEQDAPDTHDALPAPPEHRPTGPLPLKAPDFADAQSPSHAVLDEESIWGNTVQLPLPEPEPEQALPPPQAAPAMAPTPQFLKRAQRLAFWRHPVTRGVLSGMALGLVLTLSLQMVHQFRDLLAAYNPALRPYLAQWCEAMGCTIQPPLRLDALQVDSATLVRATSDGPDRYRLAVVVHNKAPVALAWPSVDLTLTDANGAVVARRVFAPAEAEWLDTADAKADAPQRPISTSHPPVAVPPQRSTTLLWQLRTRQLQPAGYTAELFYP